MGAEENVRKVLQETNELRNRARPVNKLPPEILSNVLQHRNREWDLVAATHVCRYWRSSLITSPTLWTSLRYRTEDRAHTYLERSGLAMGLDVWINLRYSDDGPGRIYPQAGRVRSLTIHGTASQVRTAISRAFCRPAPSLQHLEITVPPGSGSHCEEGIRLPDNFLGQHAPELRSVILIGVFPAFVSQFSLPSLTRLQFRLKWYGERTRTSTIFGVLSIPSQLKEVSIDLRPTPMIGHIGAPSDPDPLPAIEDLVPNSIICLESLEELQIEWVLGARIVPWLRLPRLKKLRVGSPRTRMVDLLPADAHLLLSKTTRLMYSCPKVDSRKAVFGGGGVTIEVQGHGINPINWLSDISPAWFGQIKDLVFSGFSDVMATYGIVELPVAEFGDLEVLQLDKCATRFVDLISRALDGEVIPCPSLREIRSNSQQTLTSFTGFVRRRERLVGDRVQLVRGIRTDREWED